MEIRFYDTLRHRVEVFEPIEPPNVTMYNCGLTVYDYGHIGNFRAFVFADVLRRFLELVYGPERVHQVMNITDVGHMTEDQLADGGGEDKMKVAVERLKESKKSGKADVQDPGDPYQVAQFFTNVFLEDARQLGLKIADEYPDRVPRATAHIEQMQVMIRTLLDRGHAYVASDGAVYYEVASFPAYGRLSGNTLDKLRGGAGGRVLNKHQDVKKHPSDFLLWKSDPSHLMKWDSPWGTGYPGWHIECSAMATHVLGRDVIDIHTGGEDNIFPHHECEIAQTCGATGNDTFARFWMHTRFLLVEGEKMSKSKGNFLTLRDLTTRGIDPVVVRYELLKSHYRSNADFTFKGLGDSASAVRRLREAATDLERRADGATAPIDLSHAALKPFAAALGEDLNIAGALGSLFTWLSGDHPDPAESLAVLRRMDGVLGVLDGGQPGADDRNAEDQCSAIDRARAEKDFDTADRIRQKLIDAGYDVRTTKEGSTARKKLA